MLYSYPAQFACAVEDGPSYGAYEADHVATHRILRDLGYQFRYVTDRMLRLGEFDADRYRLLILPRIEALGPQEAEVIREFVRGGGVVIADVRPAIYDGHCKPSAQGLLDDVFGITTDGRAAAVKANAQIGDGPTIENLMIDPTVRLNGGSARGMAGDTPVWIENRFGEGVAILLNFTFAGFPGLHVADTPAEMAALMQGLISRQDTHPAALRMLDAGGARLRNLEAVRWVNGDTNCWRSSVRWATGRRPQSCCPRRAMCMTCATASIWARPRASRPRSSRRERPSSPCASGRCSRLRS